MADADQRQGTGRLWRDPGHLLACGLGSGLAPTAPGTAGTLIGVFLFLVLCRLPWAAYIGVTAALFVAGMWLCGRTATALGKPDPRQVVWDEIVGFLVAMTALPPTWAWIAAAFALFRTFDILKPWPISVVDRRVSGGFGIMLDDLVAGLYALAVLQAARSTLT